MLRWGTGAINVGACRVPHSGNGDRAESEGKNQHTHYKNPNSNRDSYSGDFPPRQDYDGSARRWPANVVHDGSDEVLAGFPVTGGDNRDERDASNTQPGMMKLNGQGWRPFHDEPIRIRATPSYHEPPGSAARFFYCAKASKADRDDGFEGLDEVKAMRYGEIGQGPLPQQMPAKPVPQRNHHPTVKPTPLMRWLVRLVTPPDGVVLDPFAGSGSTGKACVLEGFSFIGMDTDPEYVEIARRRIAAAQLPLLTECGDPY